MKKGLYLALVLFMIFPGLLFYRQVMAQTGCTETTLMASGNEFVFGEQVTLTATVSPNTAEGKVTFYDGTTVLGIRTLDAGTAAIETSLLPTGTRSLRAYFRGLVSGESSSSWSDPISLVVNAEPANGFQVVGDYTLDYPQQVAVDDFNGDGNADLVIAAAHLVGVMLGNGDGTFQTAICTGAPGNPVIGVGDFTSDGTTDLVIGNYTSGRFETWGGLGDGSFIYSVSYFYTNPDQYPHSVAVADFKLDGYADLMVGCGSLKTFACWNNVHGSFIRGETGVTADVDSVAVGDFNKDGNTDAVVTDVRTDPDRVAVLLGNEYGNFTSVVSYNVGDHPASVRVGDFNGDGNPDLVVANWASDNVSILLGNGEGTFQTAVNYNVGDYPQSVAVGDLNGDGNADLFVANSASDNVSILLGNGDGTFQTAVNLNIGGNPKSVEVGEFNEDGLVDLVIMDSSNDNIRVLLGIVDSTSPVIVATVTGTPGLDDWYSSNVYVTWSVVDAESGIVSCIGCDSTCLTGDTAGVTLTCSATNGAGLSTSVPVTVKIDKTRPVITYTGNAYIYTVDQTVSITCSASDNLSGISSTTCSDISCPAYTFSIGQNNFDAQAIDNAGNVGIGSTSFTVQVTYSSLSDLTQQFVSNEGISKALCQSLDVAAKAAARGNLNAKANAIDAYTRLLRSQLGKTLSSDQVTILTRLANAL